MNEAAFNDTLNATGISALSGIEQFQFYFTPVIVYLGSIGNGLSVFVFFSTKLKKLSSSYYLAALAISDNIFLACMFVVWLRFVEIDLFNKWGWCQVIVYLTSVCSFLSVWLVLAFTVERFIAVRYPLLRQSLCTVSRAKMFILILVLISMAFSSPSAIFVTLKEERGRIYCTADPDFQNFLNIFNYADTFVTFLLPVVAITMLNVCISRTVWKLASVRRRLTNRGIPSGFHLRKTTTVLRTNRHKKNSTTQNKMTKMLLVVSTVCLCMNLPSYVMRVLADLIKLEIITNINEETFIMTQHYCQQLYYTNFSINFVLYCISGQNFRKALRSLHCPRRRLRRNETAALTESRTQSSVFLAASRRRRLPTFTESQETTNSTKVN